MHLPPVLVELVEVHARLLAHAADELGDRLAAGRPARDDLLSSSVKTSSTPSAEQLGGIGAHACVARVGAHLAEALE